MLSNIRVTSCPRHVSSCWSIILCLLLETVDPQWLEFYNEATDSSSLGDLDSYLFLLFDLCSFSAWWGELIHSTFYLRQARSLEELWGVLFLVFVLFWGTPTTAYLVASKLWRNVCNINYLSIGSSVELNGVTTTQDLSQSTWLGWFLHE